MPAGIFFVILSITNSSGWAGAQDRVFKFKNEPRAPNLGSTAFETHRTGSQTCAFIGKEQKEELLL
jgi:hypothetical protein